MPKYEVDPFWLKIPAKWVVGPLGGACIDAQDHLFILHRQEGLSTLTARDRKDEMMAAPPVMEFDPKGNLVNSWGDASVLGQYLHDCNFDKEGNTWIVGARSGFAQKWTHDGKKLLLQIGKSGVFDSSDGTSKGKPLNSNFNGQLRHWVWQVSNKRVHGTTHEPVDRRWDEEKLKLQAIAGRLPYPYVDEELRRVARDAYVSWESNRYSVPWTYVGTSVWVRDREGQIEVHYGGQRIATHPRTEGKHQIVTVPEHHRGIPLGANGGSKKILVHIQQTAPSVEVRSLTAYESIAAGGLQ